MLSRFVSLLTWFLSPRGAAGFLRVMDPKLVDDIHRGTSYDLGQQPLLPGSPTGRPKGKQRRKPRLPLGCFWPLWSERLVQEET